MDGLIITDTQDKLACFHESTLAIAASGTVALELASYGVPTIIGYVTSSLNYWLARWFATVKYICTVNILADQLLVPELIQHDCTVPSIYQQALPLLERDSASTIHQKIRTVIDQLKGDEGITPQERVARMILSSLI